MIDVRIYLMFLIVPLIYLITTEHQAIETFRWNKPCCYTFQLKYIFLLEEKFTCHGPVIGQTLVSSSGNSNLNSRVIRSCSAANLCISQGQANNFSRIFILRAEWYNINVKILLYQCHAFAILSFRPKNKPHRSIYRVEFCKYAKPVS